MSFLPPRRALIWSLLWALIILVLTLMPGEDVPDLGWAELLNLDKPVHAVLFGIQTWLLGVALSGATRWGKPWRRPALTAAGISLVYGGLTELLQGTMMLGRTADPFDLLADGVGITIAYLILRRSMQGQA